MPDDIPHYIVIAGPTASGKTALSIEIAQQLDGEIVSCDSIQFYRGFDVGSAKPSLLEQSTTIHHLIDCLDWHEDFDARQYADRARDVIRLIANRGKTPIVVGGTGLYLRALWQQNWHELPKSNEIRELLSKLTNEQLYKKLLLNDPNRAASIHVNDRYRLLRANEVFELTGKPFPNLAEQKSPWRDKCYAIFMSLPRKNLHQRIEQRCRSMLDMGLIDEVRCLIAGGCESSSKPMQSIGYRQVMDYLNENGSEELLLEKMIAATRQYAKRQETWFRKVAFDYTFQALQDSAKGLLSDGLRGFQTY